jgi:alpha-1,3-rhamnosyl/mannosyltransferase
MKSGCPVVYSQDSCLDEIMDSNGIKFNPHSQTKLEEALKKLWDNPDLRQKYIKLGLNHAKNFNWELTAKQTLALYNLTLSNEK